MKRDKIALSGKKVTVLGLGRSGLAACKLLLSEGAVVFGSDKGSPNVDIPGLELEIGEHTERIFESELLVVSPGISQYHWVIEEAKKRGIKVIGEIELASSLFEGKLIAVTGTNGKTTTCALIKEMLTEAGCKAALGGNISPGIPLSEAVMNADRDTIMVTEVSTFQLETIDMFKPFIGIITNITPDHLDRHKDFEIYVQLKRKLFKNQDGADYTILNYDQEITRATEKVVKSKVYFFSVKQDMENGVFLSGDDCFYKKEGKSQFLFKRTDVRLQGMHNLENILAASLVNLILDYDIQTIRKVVKNFAGVPHRLEFVKEINSIKFVNNSMCTNPVAFRRSIESIKGSFILICGGRNKNLELEKMTDSIKKARYAIIIGECAPFLADALEKSGYRRFSISKTMEEAVDIAFREASIGDTVLLSPGGSSFDMFKDFAERGNCFKESVGRLSNG